MSDREDYKDNRRVRHNTPRVGDRVYIEGKWVDGVWVKASNSRVNGRIIYVDRDSEEAKVSMTDHPSADKEEPKTLHLPFSIFYGRWDVNRDLFVLTDECVS